MLHYLYPYSSTTSFSSNSSVKGSTETIEKYIRDGRIKPDLEVPVTILTSPFFTKPVNLLRIITNLFSAWRIKIIICLIVYKRLLAEENSSLLFSSSSPSIQLPLSIPLTFSKIRLAQE
jgi:hypothetical protein